MMGLAGRGSRTAAMAGAMLGLVLGVPSATSADDPPKRVRVAVKIMDIGETEVRGGLRAVASVCEKLRTVDLYYTASGLGDDWTRVASTESDRGGFWEFELALPPGGYQARVGTKVTRDYRCKRSFSDVEEVSVLASRPAG